MQVNGAQSVTEHEGFVNMALFKIEYRNIHKYLIGSYDSDGHFLLEMCYALPPPVCVIVVIGEGDHAEGVV